METEPVTSIVAENIGANVFFTRLKGHGHYQLSSQENVKLSDWLYDAAEALEAGKKTGEKVIVISCSSGAPLAAWLCSNYPSQIHAAVMISPNFSPADKRANIISYRWGPLLARLIEGEVAGDNEIVISPEHAAGWSYIYRTEMLFPMIALLEKASEIDYSAIEIPLMVFYSEEDKIVDHDATRKVFEMWGSGSKQLVKIENPGDRNSHIIAGDIFSPATTSFAAKKITEFLTR